jgi:8-oxo-dGTP diphosphatase
MNVMTDSAAELRSPRMPLTTPLAWFGLEIRKNRRKAITAQVKIFFMFTIPTPSMPMVALTPADPLYRTLPSYGRFVPHLAQSWPEPAPERLPYVGVIISEHPVIRCVGAVICDPSGRLLLIRRANEPGKGKWSLPGGRVDQGESDHSAVCREVREETGLQVTVERLVGRVFRPAPQGTYEIVDYACRSNEWDAVAGDDAADVRWVDAETFSTWDYEGRLTDGLADALRDWECLPRAEPGDR